jgi:putative intracellular protease/amidase
MLNNRILIVVTSHNTIGEQPTGLWLEEFTKPYAVFAETGAEMVVASPRGGRVPIDPRSLPITPELMMKHADALTILERTQSLESIRSALDFDAIFIPGGHGAMFDLAESAHLQRLLRYFAQQDKTIAAVCHGPAALIGVQRPDGLPFVSGRTLTAFTDEEEAHVHLDHLVPFPLERQLRALGARFVAKEKWSEHVEQDGHLLTGQNPQSSTALAQAVIESLSTQPLVEGCN